MKEEGGGTTDAKETNERHPPALEELIEYAKRPRTEEELELRREAGRAMDRVRVKVGRDSNVAREIRRMRDAAEGRES